MPADSTVQRQYQEFPYPPRDPEQERTRLRSTSLGQLGIANYLLWAGARPYDADFRVLDAGCGTGDSAVFLAEQLRDTPARVHALDISPQSLEITQQRAEVRGLTNLQLHQGAIEDAPDLGLGLFDYVVASGVLHHLVSPTQGLRVLRAVLKPDGGVGIMVYGRYGRTAIYQLQELFRVLAPPDQPTDRRLHVVRQILPSLHDSHWAAFNRDFWQKEWDQCGDAGLYDLLLHSQDRAYTVPEIYDWMRDAGMQLVRFDVPQLYDPALYQSGVDCSSLSLPDQQAVAELLLGRMTTHHFLVARDDYAVPAAVTPTDESAVPIWLLHDPEREAVQTVRTNNEFQIKVGMLTKTFKLNGPARALLARVDGRTPLGEIVNAVDAALPAVPRKRIWGKWKELYPDLRDANVIGLTRAA